MWWGVGGRRGTEVSRAAGVSPGQGDAPSTLGPPTPTPERGSVCPLPSEGVSFSL